MHRGAELSCTHAAVAPRRGGDCLCTERLRPMLMRGNARCPHECTASGYLAVVAVSLARGDFSPQLVDLGVSWDAFARIRETGRGTRPPCGSPRPRSRREPLTPGRGREPRLSALGENRGRDQVRDPSHGDALPRDLNVPSPCERFCVGPLKHRQPGAVHERHLAEIHADRRTFLVKGPAGEPQQCRRAGDVDLTDDADVHPRREKAGFKNGEQARVRPVRDRPGTGRLD